MYMYVWIVYVCFPLFIYVNGLATICLVIYLLTFMANDIYICTYSICKYVWFKHTYIHTEVFISSLPLLHILLSFTLLALFVDSQMATTNNKKRSWTCPHSLLRHADTHTHTRTLVCVSVVTLLISCVARLLCWGLFSLPISLSFCSVITSVAEQETVNARCFFTSLCLFPAVAVYPWFVV